MYGVRTLLFSIVVVLFGGFTLVGDIVAFGGDGGYWIMVAGLFLGVLGLALPPLGSRLAGSTDA